MKNWCGHTQDVVPWQEPDGLWTLIPLVGTAASMSGLTIGTPPEVTRAWMASPDTIRDVAGDADLQAIAVRIQEELAEMESRGDPAACRLCGGSELTEEDAPSQASGNRGRVISGKIDLVATRVFGTIIWTGEEISGGSVVKTLCKRCNNDTGRRYNQTYIKFETACRPLARPEAAGTLCSVRVAQRPLVAKQVLTCSTPLGLASDRHDRRPARDPKVPI